MSNCLLCDNPTDNINELCDGCLQELEDPSYWIKECTENLYFLCRCVLQTLEDPTPGFKDLYRPTHARMCNFLTEYAVAGQHCILLFPRHWIKSYIITCGWALQRIMKNALSGKRESFLFSHAVEPRAIALKGRVKHNLLYNDFLTSLLSMTNPEVAKQLVDPENTAELWTKEEDRIWGNILMTGAVEKTLESTHFNIHIGDDLVVRENSNTSTQLDKVENWWKLARPLLSPKGIEILVGTRYGFDDLYGRLIERFIKPEKGYNLEAPIVELHRDNWHLLQADCWEDQENRTGSTFPYLFPEKELKRLEIEMGDEFSYQYRNDPIAKGKRKYKRTDFKYYDDGEIPLIVNTVMLLDVTDKEKDTSDYTGIMVADIGVDKKAYIRRAWREKITDSNLIDRLCEIAPQYNPASISIESTKYLTILELMEILVPRKLRTGEIPKGYREFVATLPHIINELKHRGRPKKVRIENMHGYVERGAVRFPRNGAEDLIEELLRLGSWKTDDTADAFGYLQDVLVFPDKTDPERESLLLERIKKSPEEQEAEDWERYKEDCLLGASSPEVDLW